MLASGKFQRSLLYAAEDIGPAVRWRLKFDNPYRVASLQTLIWHHVKSDAQLHDDDGRMMPNSSE